MNRYAPYGATLLRLALGLLFIVHSAYLKLVVFTLPGTVAFFESLGLPGLTAHAVIAAEIVGGVLLLLGIRVTEAASILTVVALGATWAHLPSGWLFSNEGGGWEYPLFLAAATATQALLGPGALRVRLPRSKADHHARLAGA